MLRFAPMLRLQQLASRLAAERASTRSKKDACGVTITGRRASKARWSLACDKPSGLGAVVHEQRCRALTRRHLRAGSNERLHHLGIPRLSPPAGQHHCMPSAAAPGVWRRRRRRGDWAAGRNVSRRALSHVGPEALLEVQSGAVQPRRPRPRFRASNAASIECREAAWAVGGLVIQQILQVLAGVSVSRHADERGRAQARGRGGQTSSIAPGRAHIPLCAVAI